MNKPYVMTLRDQQMIYDFWDMLTLERVGRKYGLTRERVRQIYERNGFNGNEVKQAIKDYNYFLKIEREWQTCSCGRNFKLDVRRHRATELCSPCFLKKRYELDGYKWQNDWRKRHPKYQSPNAKENWKKYFIKNREELNRKSLIRAKLWRKNNPELAHKRDKAYYKKNREHLREYAKYLYIKNRL